MAERIQIGGDFWSSFVADYWEKRPKVFQSVLQTSPLTEDDVIQSLESVKKLAAGQDVRLYAGNRLVLGREALRFATSASDLSTYVNSVSDSLSGDPCGIVVNNIHLYCPRLWSFFESLTADLASHVGIPGSMVHSAMLIGNYTTTPFGIHRDDAGVLTFVVKGPKRMLVWPYNYFANRRDVIRIGDTVLAEPESFADDALVLEAGPGDIMYWPSSYWHVAVETEKHVHATVSLGYWFMSSISGIVADAVREALNRDLREEAAYMGSWQNPTSTLPAELERAADALDRLIEAGEIRRRIEEYWTRRVEASGFTVVPSGLPMKPRQKRTSESS